MIIYIEQIEEIAKKLVTGKECVIDIMQEAFYFIDPSEEEANSLLLGNIKSDKHRYIKLGKMAASDLVQSMLAFTEESVVESIKDRLVNALKMPQPIRNFIFELEYNEWVQAHWMQFKIKKLAEWVEIQLEAHEEIEIPPPIMEFPPFQSGGFFDDDGNQYDPEELPIPSLCLLCKKYNNSKEEIFCHLARLDHFLRDEEDFDCGAYEKEG